MEYTDIQNAIRGFSLSALATRYAAPPGSAIIGGSDPGKPIYADPAKIPLTPQQLAKQQLQKEQKGIDQFIQDLAAEKQMEQDGVTPDKEAGKSADTSGLMNMLSSFLGSSGGGSSGGGGDFSGFSGS